MGTFRVCSLFASVLVLIAESYGQTPDYLFIQSSGPGNFVWVTPGSQIDLPFRVKSEDENTDLAKECLVVLSPQPYVSGANTYTVVLQEGGGNYHRIKRGDQVVATYYGAIITKGQFNNIWVSWRDKTITVGCREMYGDCILLRYSDPNPIPVHAVGFGARHYDALFEVPQYYALSTYFMSNNDLKPTWITKRSDQSIVFGARAASGVVVGLSASYTALPPNTNLYVRLGASDNTKSTIGVSYEDLAEEETPGILSPNEYRYFWLSWTELSIKVGKGTHVGNNQFMMYTYVPGVLQWDDFEAVNLYSDTQDIYYQEHKIPANYFFASTYPLTPNNQNLSIEQKKVFVFNVRACSRAIVGLTRPGASANYLRVLMGMGTDRKDVEIITGIESPNVQVFTTDYTFSCEKSGDFWLSWRQGLYELGRGSVPYVDTMLSFQDPSQIEDFVDLYLGTDESQDIPVEWKFDIHAGSEINIDTTVNYAWLTVHDQTSLFFGVKASSDVQVILASYMMTGLHSTYSVIVRKNDKTMIAKNGVIIQETSKVTKNILDYNKINHFWIDWTEHVIRFGRGLSIGVDTIVSYDGIKDGIDINEVGFDSTSNAAWQFSFASGDDFAAQTKPAEQVRLEKNLRS